jgi:hypothetical protein
MKIKAILTINTGVYMDLRPEIEIEVPDGLKNKALVQYLHREYWGCLTPEALKGTHNQTSVAGIKSRKAAAFVAKKDGVDVDNLHYEGDSYQRGEQVDWEKQ